MTAKREYPTTPFAPGPTPRSVEEVHEGWRSMFRLIGLWKLLCVIVPDVEREL